MKPKLINFLTLLKLLKDNGSIYRRLRKPPIVICGAPRSGTTLLLSILDSHPQIVSIPKETYLLTSDRTFRTPFLNRLKKSLEICSCLQETDIKLTANRWCEKTPNNVRYLDKILAEFGKRIRILHIVRDGRDVICSQHPTNPIGYWVSAEEWINDVQAGLKHAENPNVMTLKYEDLVTCLENTMAKIFAFLGLPMCITVLDHTKTTTINKFDSWFDQATPVNRKSVGRWRRPANKDRVDELEKIHDGKQLLSNLGYID